MIPKIELTMSTATLSRNALKHEIKELDEEQASLEYTLKSVTKSIRNRLDKIKDRRTRLQEAIREIKVVANQSYSKKEVVEEPVIKDDNFVDKDRIEVFGEIEWCAYVPNSAKLHIKEKVIDCCVVSASHDIGKFYITTEHGYLIKTNQESCDIEDFAYFKSIDEINQCLKDGVCDFIPYGGGTNSVVYQKKYFPEKK